MHLFELIPSIECHPLFSCVQAEALDKYFNQETMKIKNFPCGSVICSPDSVQNGVGIVMSGLAQVTSGSQKENALLKSISTGDLFGIANLYTRESPFPSIIIAKSDCCILTIEEDAFRSYIEQEAPARQAYLSFLSGKILYLNQKIAIFTAGSAEKRLAFFLLENASDGIWDAPCSMGNLANLLGIGRASLYRAIDGLSQINLIQKEEKKLSIIDPNKLKAFLNTL